MARLKKRKAGKKIKARLTNKAMEFIKKYKRIYTRYRKSFSIRHLDSQWLCVSHNNVQTKLSRERLTKQINNFLKQHSSSNLVLISHSFRRTVILSFCHKLLRIGSLDDWP